MLSAIALLLTHCSAEPESSTQTPSAAVTSADPVVPLADGAFAVAWLSNTLPSTVQKGSAYAGTVTVRNQGTVTWPNMDALKTQPPGAGAVRVGVRWWKKDGPEPPPNGHYLAYRGELPRSLNPGDTSELPIEVPAPSEPGTYLLQVDMVQELVAWFSTKGAEPLTIEVNVSP